VIRESVLTGCLCLFAQCVKLGDFGLAAYSVQDEPSADAGDAQPQPEPEPEPEQKQPGGDEEVGSNASNGPAGDARIEVLDEMSFRGSGSISPRSSSYSGGSISSSSGSNVGGMSSSQHGGGGVGTALYAAPEQLGASNNGGNGSAHAPADVYSLGVT